MFIFLSYTQDSAAHGSLGTEFPCTLSFLFLDNMLVRLFRSVSQSFWLEEQLLSSGFAGDTDGVNKRALVKLCRRGFRTALPSIYLENVHSLSKTMDELLLFNKAHTDFSRSPAQCFTETWLSEHLWTARYICQGSNFSESTVQRH